MEIQFFLCLDVDEFWQKDQFSIGKDKKCKTPRQAVFFAEKN